MLSACEFSLCAQNVDNCYVTLYCLGSGMRMGPWHVQDRTSKWLLRCDSACLACRGYFGALEGGGNHFVSISSFSPAYTDLANFHTRLISVPSSTCYMLTYDHLLHEVFPSLLPPYLVPLTAGITARTIVTTIASPLELIRTNLQSTPPSPSTPHTLRSTLASVGALAHAHGHLHLWRGLGPTLWRDVPFSGIYWAGYESCKRALNRAGHEGAGVAFVSGAFSGTTAALFTSPFDVLKTRKQALLMSGTTGGANIGSSGSSISVLREVLRTEGVSALYTGVVPRIVKIAPACGIMIACFEVYRLPHIIYVRLSNCSGRAWAGS